MIKCWECETETDNIHHHHVVPRSRGGKKTVPLCLDCHGKAHHRKDSMTTSALTKEGQERKRNRSKEDGTWAGGRPPKGFKVSGGRLVRSEAWDGVLRALELRAAGEPLRVVAANLGVSIPAARKACLKWSNDPEAFRAFMNQPEKLFAYLKDDTKEKQ